MATRQVRSVPLLAGPSALVLSFGLIPPGAAAQTRADYERALGMRERYQYSTVGVPDAATWVSKSSRFCYRRSVKGGHEFVMVDADTQQRRPAFDHERLAAALSKETGDKHTPLRLPFESFTFTVADLPAFRENFLLPRLRLPDLRVSLPFAVCGQRSRTVTTPLRLMVVDEDESRQRFDLARSWLTCSQSSPTVSLASAITVSMPRPQLAVPLTPSLMSITSSPAPVVMFSTVVRIWSRSFFSPSGSVFFHWLTPSWQIAATP